VLDDELKFTLTHVYMALYCLPDSVPVVLYAEKT